MWGQLPPRLAWLGACMVICKVTMLQYAAYFAGFPRIMNACMLRNFVALI